MLCIDFEKAFDSVEWCLVFRSLEMFNFPPKFINLVKKFYNDITTCTINNGHISRFFKPSRGVRQGCPLSPVLFVIAVELLSLLIRNNQGIEGITMNGKNFKIAQFADDTSFTVTNNKQNISEIFKTLKNFESVSGLKVNKDKTEALLLGRSTVSNTPASGRPFIRQEIKLLGVSLCTEASKLCRDNYDPIIEKMKTTLDRWRNRRLSLAGRICILKSLVMAKLIYCVSVLPAPSKNMVKEIQDLMYEFIWKGKSERIARKVLIGDYRQGGYRMPDLDLQIKALKTSWLIKAAEIEGSWKEYLLQHLPMQDLNYFLRSNLKYCDLPNKPQKEDIWTEVLIYWCCMNYKDSVLGKAAIMDQNIWWNTHIQIARKVVFYQKWADKGVRTIGDLCDDNGRWLSYTEFCAKFKLVTPFTLYQGILSTIPTAWKQALRATKPGTQEPHNSDEDEDDQHHLIDKFQNPKGASRKLYKILQEKAGNTPLKVIQRWEEEANITIDVDRWLKCLYDTRAHTICNRVRSGTYKFFLRDVSYNARLEHMGLSDTDKCQWCPRTRETILHLYWHCPYSVEVWKHLVTTFGQIYKVKIHLDLTRFLFGHMGEGKDSLHSVFDVLCSLTKTYVHKCKCKGIKCESIGLDRYIKYIRDIERRISLQSNNMYKFVKKWDKMSQWEPMKNK